MEPERKTGSGMVKLCTYQQDSNFTATFIVRKRGREREREREIYHMNFEGGRIN